MNVYTVEKTNGTNGKTYKGSVVAANEADAKVAALAQMRKPAGYTVTIVSVKPQKTYSADEDFANRTGLDPQQYENE
jgi:hypothetical protein